ncbi:MAG: hypothetical protein OD815_000700 [Candidatus Alkanophagales archaeon MCA70_species_2]|nr:hypothetical protein [Candidatus Alkanophaga liquidiphilum]
MAVALYEELCPACSDILNVGDVNRGRCHVEDQDFKKFLRLEVLDPS